MTDEIIDEMAELYKMFSDPTRLKILEVLRSGERCVQDIADAVDMSHSSVSHSLSSLRVTRLVKSRKEGKSVIYSLDDRHIEELLDIAKEHVLHR